MKLQLFFFLIFFLFLSKNISSQNFSDFKSLFNDIPKEGILIKPGINFEGIKIIDKKFASILTDANYRINELYALYKIEIDKNYMAFIIGYSGYVESGGYSVYMKIYDLKNKKFVKNKKYAEEDETIGLVQNTGDEGWARSTSSIISDFNYDKYYDILNISYDNDNGKIDYYTELKLWKNNQFINQNTKMMK